MRSVLIPATLALWLASIAGCGEKDEPTISNRPSPTQEERLARRLSGTIRADGPRVLHPLVSAAGRNFGRETGVEVEVGQSGTAVAFDKLCSGRIAVAGARRAMRPAEREVCRRRDIGLKRLTIAHLAVAVATSEELGLRCITLRELRELWSPGSRITRYRQLGPRFPAAPVRLYGAKVGRAVFSLFTRRVNGNAGAIRGRWEPAPNRTALTARVRRSSNALAFYNLAELKPVSDLDLVAVDGRKGCVEPSNRSIQSGGYPLAEPLYVYVSERALDKLRVRSFMRYFIEDYEQQALTAPSTTPASAEEIAHAERQLPKAPIPSG